MEVLSQVEAQNVPVLVASNVVVGRFPWRKRIHRRGAEQFRCVDVSGFEVTRV